MLFNSAIPVLSFANKVVKVQAQKFVRSLYGVPRTLHLVLVRTDYCYFHQTATLNMRVFLFLPLFSQKTNVTIVFSMKFSFKIIFYLNFEKNGLLLFSQRILLLKNF